MPEISRFFGIVVTMHYEDHAPPHFHVRYGGRKAIICIDTLSVLKGKLSPKALALIIEWAAVHQAELSENWARAENNAALMQIAPLE
jgi:hypothetical protein